jgi:predicted RNA-binding Zn ribbon-like protein
VWLPERVSGHPALELNNTVGGWLFDEPREYLADYATLVILSRDVGLLDAPESAALLSAARRRPAAADAVLCETKELREALHAIVIEEPLPQAAAEQLHRFVIAAVGESTYRRDAAGSLRLDGGAGVRVPLHRFALSLHSLLDGQPRNAIRPCADERCGWVFFDPSGRRRWCEMSVCGNRAKARRFAERHRVR